jgi:hypothetical protein
MEKPNGAQPAPEALQERVRKLMAKEGTDRAAEMLGLSRGTVTTLAAGAPVQKGTIALAQQKLAGLRT